MSDYRDIADGIRYEISAGLQTHGTTNFAHGYLGDADGNVVAPPTKGNRMVFWRDVVTNAPGTAYLGEGCGIPYEDNPDNWGKPILLAYPPSPAGSPKQYTVIRLDGNSGQASLPASGKTPAEEKQDVASAPTLDNLLTCRIGPTNPPTTAVQVSGNLKYRNAATGEAGYFTTDAKDLIDAINALSSGQHQLGLIYLDTTTGNLGLVTTNAVTASGSLPNPAAFTFVDAQTLPTNRTWIEFGVVYIWHGQTNVREDSTQNDFMRSFDPRPLFELPAPSIKRVALTAQNATIAATDIMSPPTDGEYSIHLVLTTTTAGSAGTSTATITWTDENGTQTSTTSSLSLSATGNTTLSLPIHAKTSGAIQYSTTVTGATGSPAYSLYINVMRLS